MADLETDPFALPVLCPGFFGRSSSFSCIDRGDTWTEGKLIAEINPKTGENQKLLDRLSDILTQPDIQIATSGGVASLLLGLNPLFAGAIFTGSWIVTKYGLASI
ncbi:MAG TPA: hypothetical protein ENK96_02265, partial [Desulfobulbaceae bacterium]|nr:hypothetical protein [Desulfobulbaceae bacterium]